MKVECSDRCSAGDTADVARPDIAFQSGDFNAPVAICGSAERESESAHNSALPILDFISRRERVSGPQIAHKAGAISYHWSRPLRAERQLKANPATRLVGSAAVHFHGFHHD